jgi:membrane associated rhomboid family serine protease
MTSAQQPFECTVGDGLNLLASMACVMVVAWVTGFLCDKGMPHMIASGIVYIVAGALCLLLTE